MKARKLRKPYGLVLSPHPTERRQLCISSPDDKKSLEITRVNLPPLAPGKDYLVYDFPEPGLEVVIDADTSPGDKYDDAVLVGGFHTLCADVGEIPGHPLSGYLAKDILPRSVWSTNHRANCPDNHGMVYDPDTGIWVDIYLASGTGKDTRSEHGGAVSVSRLYNDFVQDASAVGKRLPTHEEFASFAAASNELTRIGDKKARFITGGHQDQKGRRMISGIGCEDCCGLVWQWLSTADNDDPDKWRLIAGGHWGSAAYCGSRSRYAYCYRWYTASHVGARFVAAPRKQSHE